MLSLARMRHESERDELCGAIEVFAIQLRAQRALWRARGDEVCLTALARLVDERDRTTQPAEELEVLLDRVRQSTIAVARELDRAATDHGKPHSRADTLARRAIIDLLTTLTDLEDELYAARERSEQPRGTSG